MLSEVEPGTRPYDDLSAKVAAAGYLLATPNDLFTHRFAQLAHKAIVDGHMESSRGHLLPLSPLALLLHEPAVLARSVEIEDQGGDRVTVVLKLPLAHARREHEAAKQYTERTLREVGVMDRNVDWSFGEAAVWPNF